MGWWSEQDPVLKMLRVWPADGRHAVLVEEYCFADARGVIHRARAGLRTDGGSIPRVCWVAIEHPFGRCLPAYVIHDQECDDASVIADPKARAAAYEAADTTFDEMLLELGAPFLKRLLMVRAVRRWHRANRRWPMADSQGRQDANG